MIRLLILCEGQSEALCVREFLQPHLHGHGVDARGRVLGRPGRKGGAVSWQRVLGDLRELLMGSGRAQVSSFLDYYGIDRDFPGRQAASGATSARQRAMCAALVEALRPLVGDEPLRRFIPYIQMHEFEGLLFSDPVRLAHSIDHPEAAPALVAVANAFPTPEDINDDPLTAPSKRIVAVAPDYQKTSDGMRAMAAQGLAAIRARCPLFDAWIAQLEALGSG